MYPCKLLIVLVVSLVTIQGAPNPSADPSPSSPPLRATRTLGSLFGYGGSSSSSQKNPGNSGQQASSSPSQQLGGVMPEPKPLVYSVRYYDNKIISERAGQQGQPGVVGGQGQQQGQGSQLAQGQVMVPQSLVQQGPILQGLMDPSLGLIFLPQSYPLQLQQSQPHPGLVLLSSPGGLNGPIPYPPYQVSPYNQLPPQLIGPPALVPCNHGDQQQQLHQRVPIPGVIQQLQHQQQQQQQIQQQIQQDQQAQAQKLMRNRVQQQNLNLPYPLVTSTSAIPLSVVQQVPIGAHHHPHHLPHPNQELLYYNPVIGSGSPYVYVYQQQHVPLQGGGVGIIPIPAESKVDEQMQQVQQQQQEGNKGT